MTDHGFTNCEFRKRQNRQCGVLQAGGHLYCKVDTCSGKAICCTKVRSRNFGVAAAAGKALRQLLLPVLPFPKDRRMQIRFSGAIAQWLHDPATIPPADKLPFVNNFQFNTSTALAERWKLPLTVTQSSTGLIEVRIPDFVPTAIITAPARTSVVECTFTAASCLLADGTLLGSSTKKLVYPILIAW